MPVVSPASPVDSETGQTDKPPTGLRNLLLAGILVLVVLLMLGLPRQSPDGWLPAPFISSRDEVAVFFSKVNGTESITEAVKRPVPDAQKNRPLQFALQALLKGPSDEEKKQGFYSEIPAGTRLLKTAMQHDNVVVDFSKEFSSGGGSTTMIQRLKQVKDTVYAIDTHYPIIVEVEGQVVETLGGEGLEVSPSMQIEQP